MLTVQILTTFLWSETKYIMHEMFWLRISISTIAVIGKVLVYFYSSTEIKVITANQAEPCKT